MLVKMRWVGGVTMMRAVDRLGHAGDEVAILLSPPKGDQDKWRAMVKERGRRLE